MVALAKSPPDHYRTLGLDPGATAREIEEAFQALVREHMQHPDLAEPAQRQRARQVNLAYETLRDPDRRRDYDASLGLAGADSAEADRATHERSFLFVAPAAPLPSSTDLSRPTETSADSDDDDLAGDSDEHSTTSSWRATPFIAATPFAPAATSTAASPRHLRLEDEFAASPPPPPDEELPEHTLDEGPSRGRKGAVLAAAALVLGLGAGALFLTTEGEQPGTPEAPSTRMADAQTAPSAASPPPATQPAAGQDTLDDAVAETPGTEGQIEGATSASPPSPAQETATAPVRTAEAAQPQPLAGSPSSAEPARPAAEPEPAPTRTAAAEAPPPPQPSRPAARRIATPARWLGGGLVNGDNPRGRFEGNVSVSFTVGAGGNVTGCRAIVSSGNAELDATTCRLVEQRLRFSPALDANGQPIASEVRSSYGWGKRRRR